MPRVLVVDDEPALLRLLETYLSRKGYAVECYSTATEGLAALEKADAQFDIAVLDHWLPDMSGMELLEGVLRRFPTLPVLISSGSLMEIDSLEIPPGATVGFLQKPYLPKALSEQIEVLLRK